MFYAIRPVLTFISVLFVMLVAMTLWNGASEAIRIAGVKRRLPAVRAGEMARPLHLVLTGTPLAEALRQRDEAVRGEPIDATAAGAGASVASIDPRVGDTVALGVCDSSGQVIALVSGVLAARVPIGRRPWVDVDSVSREVVPAQRIPADTVGMDVLEAVQANPGRDLLVTVGEDVVGVLRVRGRDHDARVQGAHHQ